jgi:aminopeptidase N
LKAASAALMCCLLSFPSVAPGQTGAPLEKARLMESEQRRYSSLMKAFATPPAASNIDVTYYGLDLTIATPPQQPLLSGHVLIKAISRSDTLRQVPLDLSDPMTVDSVVMNGSPVAFSHAFSLLWVTLDRTYPSGQLFGFTVYYHGLPVPTGFHSFEFSSHGTTPWVWSLSEPYGARDWWPCKDHPLDKADSVDVRVTCDAAFKVGSNGRLVSITDHGDGTHTYAWSERYPIATYLVSVALTDYVEFSDWFHYGPADSMEVLNYVLPEQYPAVRDQAAKTVTMLEVFSRLYGLYPFIKEKYGHCSFGWGGAMEHQTMTSTTTYDEYVIAHELGHQWFGDLISPGSWRDLWLNEGFATYSEALYAEALGGASAYHTYIKPIMEGAKHATGTLRVSDTTSVTNLFNASRVYDKGGSVLHMLRHLLGDTLFFESLRSYVANPTLRYATATTEDFRAACERAPGRNLGFFFDEWVDGEDFPWYQYSWSTRATPAGFETTVRLSQNAKATPPTFFTMPLDCRFSTSSWDTTVVIENNSPTQQFTMLLSHQPDTVRLDPDGWVLGEFANLNDGGLPVAFALLPNYPNPFNPTTAVPFDLPHQEYISLKVYDLLGREVATLVEGKMPAGHHEVVWNPMDNPGRSLASGAYICRLVAGTFSATRTMLLLK